MAGLEETSFGFIGLGAMGTPMVHNLADKLPAETQIYVYDIVEKAVDDVCSQHPNRVLKSGSAREVAERSVGPRKNRLLQSFTKTNTRPRA